MAGQMTQQEVEALRARLAEYDAAGGNGGGWGRSAPSKGEDVLGVNVPIKVDLGGGCSIRCYVLLPPEAMTSMDALENALRTLRDKGLPLDIYERREGWGRGNDRGGDRGRGWGGRRGW